MTHEPTRSPSQALTFSASRAVMRVRGSLHSSFCSSSTVVGSNRESVLVLIFNGPYIVASIISRVLVPSKGSCEWWTGRMDMCEGRSASGCVGVQHGRCQQRQWELAEAAVVVGVRET